MDGIDFRAMVEERTALANRLDVLDGNVWLGRPAGFPLAVEMEPEDLAAEQLTKVQGRRFLKGGLVSHWTARTLTAQDGNEAIASLESRLPLEWHTVWTGLPFYPPEPGLLPGPRQGSQRMRGVRIFPRTHGFPATDWALGDLCRWMESRRLPLFIWHTEIDWPALRALCLAFPRLPVVVESQHRKIIYHTRPLFMIMRECRSLHLEISNFAGARFLEVAVGEFGAERLLYGSFLPVGDPLVPLGMLLDAELDEAAKRLIASGNLTRLIEGVTT